MPSATISQTVVRAPRTRRHRAPRSVFWRLAGHALVALRGAPWTVRIIISAILLVASGRQSIGSCRRSASRPKCSFPSAARSPRLRRGPGGNTARSSSGTPPRSSRRNCSPRSPRWRAAATQWHRRTGGGDSAGTRRACTDPRRAPSGCFRSPTGLSRRRGLLIHNHVVVDDGPWARSAIVLVQRALHGVVASDAVEMTAALLDRRVARTLESLRIRAPLAAAASEPRSRHPPVWRPRWRCVHARAGFDSGPASDAATTTLVATSRRSTCRSASSHGWPLLLTAAAAYHAVLRILRCHFG